MSELNVNSSKTEVIWIGSKKYSAEVFHHVKWNLDWGAVRFSLLGIEFSVELNEMIQINFDKEILKIEALLKQWKNRILTPLGRITILKSLIIPKLNHLFLSLPNPDTIIIKDLMLRFYEFIWNSKIDRVKRIVITKTTVKVD